MNKRQAKKTEKRRAFAAEPYAHFSYSEIRKRNRRSHVLSIECARKQHYNYWENWTRGYPNRFPYSKWSNCSSCFM